MAVPFKVMEDLHAVADSFDRLEFKCSVCETRWHLLIQSDLLGGWVHVKQPFYCPYCGEEVVNYD